MMSHNPLFFMSLKEPIQTSGYICNFEDLEIKSVLLDEILKVTNNHTLHFCCSPRLSRLCDRQHGGPAGSRLQGELVIKAAGPALLIAYCAWLLGSGLMVCGSLGSHKVFESTWAF